MLGRRVVGRAIGAFDRTRSAIGAGDGIDRDSLARMPPLRAIIRSGLASARWWPSIA